MTGRYGCERMACCYKDGKGRCRNADRVWTDENGREYCLFHASVEKKNVDSPSFNESVFALIIEA